MSVEWIVSSCGLILLVLAVRFLFRTKIPPCLRYALWLMVALRLLVPISISATAISILNLLPGQDMAQERQRDEIGRIIYETGGAQDNVFVESDLILEPKLENLVIKKNTEQAVEATAPIKEEEEKKVKGPSKLWKAFKTGKNEIAARVTLRCVWLFGAGACGVIFLAVNLDYKRRLKRSRKNIASENLPVMPDIPVYRTQMVQTPCLFGLVRPAIYVTEDTLTDEKMLRFVLCHENTHYRQRDHWWALLRMICICAHWFNPLVWLAARLSVQDGELACDERTLKILGDKQRVDYGRALLDLSAEKMSGVSGWRISTSMSGNARQMKERLWMLANTPGRTIGIQLFVMILVMLLGLITFTGESSAKEKENPEFDQMEGQVKALGTDEWTKGAESESEVETKEPELENETDTKESKSENGAKAEGQQESDDVTNVGKLSIDLNFDGHDDLCVAFGNIDDTDVTYSCMLWNPDNNQYEYSATLLNVEVDAEQRLVSERIEDESGRYSTIFYRYDADNQLHMVRYVEENQSSDSIFARLDLTYVDDGGVYTLPAVANGTNLHRTLLAMAKQSLEELYLWTGEKVDTACFQVTNMGSVFFGLTPEDIEHSRTFLDRSFGADTAYNLSNYERAISSMYITSGRSVWYSPVLWRNFPDRMEEMTDEEIIIWYLERVPLVEECRVKSIEKRYEDMWTVHTEDDVWFEVVYDVKLKEIGMVSGPYPDYPQH